LDIERKNVSNALVFAPQYVNVLEVNFDYPEHHPEFLRNMQGHDLMEAIIAIFIVFLAISSATLTYSLLKAEKYQ
jgi:hypothetical protein